MKTSKAETLFTIFISQAVLLPIYIGAAISPLLSSAMALVSASLLVTILTYPTLPKALYRWWLAFSEIFAKINSTAILATVYCLLIVPFGLVLRVITKDPLSRSIEPNAQSYFIDSPPINGMEKPY